MFFLLAAVGGCGDSEGDYRLVTDDDVLLVEVDGAPVTLPMLEFLMEVRGVDEEDTEGMRELLDELIRLRAVANRASEEQVSSRPRVRAERMVKDIEVQYVNYLEHFQSENPVSGEEIRAVYDAQIERAGDRRYQIETIEFAAQAPALKQLDALRGGGMSFQQAIEQATVEGRIARRTDWIDASQVPADFAEVLVATDVGDVVESLLPYQGKWLIVRLAEVDVLAPPSFDEVREGIRRTLVRQQTQSMIEQTYERAEITPMLPLEDAPTE
ncbi:MAG TPA: peptidylprolyl isomerase [Wenzhouxiangellaceae bacterium]|nr:peptidylprolyl isomerase [Wenzhouxiangellaceae bacterium]